MRLARWVCAVSLFTFLPCAAFSQQHTLPLWPNGNPEPSTITGPETDPTTDSNRIVSGKVTVRITNVSKPTLSVYFPPKEKNTGAAALVLPGGAYIRLAQYPFGFPGKERSTLHCRRQTQLADAVVSRLAERC